jgi:hypothetical protein
MCAVVGVFLFVGAAFALWNGLLAGHLDTGLLVLFLAVTVLALAGLGRRRR